MKSISYDQKNLEVWEKHASIPEKFLKKISGKDYNGNSPNATYIVKCLSSLFGKCGEGWGYSIKEQGFREFQDGTVLHWVILQFWTGSRENYFEQFGQTKVAYNTSANRYKVDEDAPKKSITDAITKAASHLGIASDIYLGLYDDNKYIAPREEDELVKPVVNKKNAESAERNSPPELSIEEIEYIAHTIKALETLDSIEMLDAQMNNIANCCKERSYDRQVMKDIYKAYLKICKDNQWEPKRG